MRDLREIHELPPAVDRDLRVHSETTTGDSVTVIPAEAPTPPWTRFRTPVVAAAGRPVGAYVIENGRVHWRPAVDVTRILVTAQLVTGAIVVAHKLSRRAGPPKAYVRMGPGGWVSMKGGAVAVRPARKPFGRPHPITVHPDDRAPIWARVISAIPLQKLL